MGIVELYSDKIDTFWVNNETFLYVLDDKNNLIADYDFRTGLKLLKRDKEIVIYINDEDLIPGKWFLFATKVHNKKNKKIIKTKGKKIGVIKTRVFEEERPWDLGYSNQLHVSRKEREERLSICKSCPFFNIKDVTCQIDGSIVLETTKYADKYCPEEKWGDKESAMKKFAGDAIIVNEEEQQDFESELEEYLKGL
jgi:hypothetical protein